MNPTAIAARRRARARTASRIAAFGAVYFLWGGAYLALRYTVAEVPPMLTIAIRCAGGAAILLLWCVLKGTLVRPTVAQWRVAALAGLLLFVGCHAGLAWAEQRVSSGQAALLLTSIPLWLVLLDAAARRRLPSGRVLAGLAAGVIGVAVLTGGTGSFVGTPLDRTAILLGGFFWAAGSLVARHGASAVSAPQSTAMQLAAGAAAVALGSLISGELSGWRPIVSPRAVASLAFLTLGATTIAFAAYTWLLRETSVAATGTYAFVNPLVAVALAWAAGDEPPSLRTGLAAALVVAAVLLARGPGRGGFS